MSISLKDVKEGLLFTAALLAPFFAGAERLGELTLAKVIWAFYFFSGIVIWLLRPCMARAAFIRGEVHKLNRSNKDGRE
jgi:hypothetical protein